MYLMTYMFHRQLKDNRILHSATTYKSFLKLQVRLSALAA